MDNDKLKAMIERAKQRAAELRAEKETKLAAQKTQIAAAMTSMNVPSLHAKGWAIDTTRDWNEQQLAAIDAGLAGKSFCLIGAAGTGKTTTLKGIINSLLANNLVPPIPAERATKWLLGGKPGIVLCSFTNMAVRQIAKHFTGDVTCVTIHKLLEYEPHYYEVVGEDGENKTKLVFEPSRHSGNPLPAALRTIVVDESSMVDCELFQKLVDALPNPAAVQFIFLGDLNQLPPVYGGPILGKKLLELPIVELTQVYRQALESPIIRYALLMKDGKPIPTDSKKTVIDNGEHGKVTIYPWSKAIGWEDALIKMTGFLKATIKEGLFDFNQDMILCPFNVNFGVIEINRAIADYLGRMRKAKVYEVVAGRETHYYAVGDKVLVNKQESFITKIVKNSKYTGKRPINPELYEIDRYGGAKKRVEGEVSASEAYAIGNDFDVDALLESLVTTTIEDKVNQASHLIYTLTKDVYLEMLEAGATQREIEDASTPLSSAGEVNEVIFAYAITVHKSQGSEWRRVFVITHQSHAQMCSRELMYTAMTRAKQELFVIVEPDRGMKAGTLTSSAKKPRLKGDSLAEKLIALKERFAKEEAESQKAAAKDVVARKFIEESDDE